MSAGLNITLPEGESVYVDHDRIQLLQVVTPHRFKVRVEPKDGLRCDHELYFGEPMYILPEVMLTVTYERTGREVRFNLVAPRHRLIRREKFYNAENPVIVS